MCYPKTCSSCGKTTWGGCGMHADFVMSRVPPAQRCTCRSGGGSSAAAAMPEPPPPRKPDSSQKPKASTVSRLESLGNRLFGSGPKEKTEKPPAPAPAPAPPAATAPAANDVPKTFDYDLIVIGGGSGGLAGAKAAAKYGKKVCCLDFVKPSPQGTTWGLGGTCVNVGCIPKRLMHQAGILGEFRHDLHPYGWMCNITDAKLVHNWTTLRDNVNAHIRSLNFNARSELMSNEVTYLNALGKFVGPYKLEATHADGKKQVLTAKHFLIAVGGRPNYPSDVPGAVEFGISSDDIFRMKSDPGKTCVIGASYVALECAGFLTALGKDVTVLIRSVPLRGFDRQMADMVVENMTATGTKVLEGYVPTKIEENPKGAANRLKVSMQNEYGDKQEDTFDTVFFATGRKPDTAALGLDKVGVKMDQGGKILCNPAEQTSVSYIFAVGDVVAHGLELTPVAIRAARLLVDRLYGGKTVLMDYQNVPTTVFTPLEYGCVGLSEEAAIAKYGEQDIDVYHSSLKPLEWTVPHRSQDCYVKMIVVKSQKERVVGFHILSPVAAEITQAVAVALRCGATKADFDNTIGIHPSIAEEITGLTATKSSGKAAAKVGC